MSWRFRQDRHRRDENARQILQDLKDAGFSVRDLSQVGDDCMDAIVGRNGMDLKLEIKNPETAYGRAGMTSGQKSAAESWRGEPIIAVYSTRDVLDAFDRLMMARRRSATC